MMKTFALVSVLFFVSNISTAGESAAKYKTPCHVGDIAPCHIGDIDVRTGDDLAYVQAQRCIVGRVRIRGILMVGNEVLEHLDLGKLQSITGAIVINGNPRLKNIISKLKRVGYVDVSGNPMLAYCRAELFALRAGAGIWWAGHQLPQACGLLDWELDELEVLREYYGVE
jgi:hypothetical protein